MKTASSALLLLVFSVGFQDAPAAQQAANLTGTWDVHIEHFTGRMVNEQWIVTQDGTKVSGKVAVSGREYPLDGTADGNKINVKVTVRPPAAGEDSRAGYNIFLGTVDGNSIKGDIKKLNDDGRFVATKLSGKVEK